MRNEWHVLSLCDVVLNHAANESVWLADHPECTYNCQNSPHLRPAFLLDALLAEVTTDIEKGVWASRGIPEAEVSSRAHLDRVRQVLASHYLPRLKLQEYFLVHIDETVKRYRSTYSTVTLRDPPDHDALTLIQDPDFKRFGTTIDFSVAKRICGEDTRRLIGLLQELNHDMEQKILRDLHDAVDNVIKGAEYERLDPCGPGLICCDREHPLTTRYFTSIPETSLESLELKMFSPEGSKLMAHNGWVMGLDPTTDFASPGSTVYFRRELIAWGDSVKLNYGKEPKDCPFLWDYMTRYVERIASTFHGIRLDNCHSTPIEVAEYLLDAARRIRPDLYVIAELFTGSESTDNQFINRLGITSLIREALSAWDSHEHGRLVHRFGGDPVGAFIQPVHRPLAPSMAHAIFFDQTHDNPCPMEKRSVVDVLPSSALTFMACCAVGSNRGYDELVPHHIHVVKENRYYKKYQNDQAILSQGIITAKKVFNDLHIFMAEEGFDQIYVDQMSPDVVGVTRHSSKTHESIVTVVSTSYHDRVQHSSMELRVEGELLRVNYEATLKRKGDDAFIRDKYSINGLENYETYVKTNFPIEKSELARISVVERGATVIELHGLRPGSAISFHFKLEGIQQENCHQLRDKFQYSTDITILRDLCQNLNLNDLNKALFKCDQEEGGVYLLDGFTPSYAGLQGFMTLLNKIRPINDLGNWLPTNIRNGDWLLDYITSRMKRGSPALGKLGAWLDKEAFSLLKKVPSYLKPRYFDLIYCRVFISLLQRAWDVMSPFVSEGSHFAKALALTSIQHGAEEQSSPLPPLSPNLKNPQGNHPMVSLAAGLPHFCTGYMRNWGRDTFISLPGLFLLTGRFEEAKNIILSFAGCLRHGLIPNLLDGGKNARFNCRDAFWWWLHCIKLFVQRCESGELILKDPVSRLFPTDDSTDAKPANGDHDQPLEDVIQEGLQKHFKGLQFCELNAGSSIDAHMKNEGFHNNIGVDKKTGFVFGGNIWNCGTWMDKMGSSDKAGNRGKPSSPRDGSAVELVGLSYACLDWLSEMNAKGFYAHEYVSDGNTKWTFDHWATTIKENFEIHFHIESKEDTNDPRPDLINKLNIYKDTLGSDLPWTDYQLRCNFPIAMAVAPDLFTPSKAWKALQIAKEKLLGPLGMATLDPDDWAYRGDYHNSNDSDDPSVAHGANYHNGPEWVWPVGFFLRAQLEFAFRHGGEDLREETLSDIMKILSVHYAHIQSSDWQGLPELTNSNGQFCADSNPTQAWSAACLIEVLSDINSSVR